MEKETTQEIVEVNPLHDKAVQTVTDFFRTAKKSREHIEPEWEECDRLVNEQDGRKHITKHQWQSKLFIPYTRAIVDLILPRLAGKRPSATVVGRTPSSDVKAGIFNELLKYQQDQLQIDTKFIDWIYDSVVFGTSFLKLTWMREDPEKMPRTPEYMQKVQEFFAKHGSDVSEDDLLYDGPCLEVVSLKDIYVHPMMKSLDDRLPMIHRSEETRQELMRNALYDSDAVMQIPEADNDVSFTIRKAHDIDQEKKHFVEVLEYWGPFDINDDGVDEECLIVIGNQKKVLRLEENPYYDCKKPFIELRYYPDPHFFYGKSPVALVKHLQYELNDIRNHRMDTRMMSLHTPLKLVTSSERDPDNYRIGPGVIWPVDNKDDIEPVVLPFASGIFEQEETSVKRDMQMATGINDVAIGGEEVGIASDTATGAQIAQEQSSLRFRVPILMVDAAIRRFGQMLIARNQQFFDREKTIRVVADKGAEFLKIKPGDIMGQFDYEVTQGSMAPESPRVKFEQAANMKAMFAGDPTIDQVQLNKDVFEAGNKDPDLYVVEQPPMGMDGMAPAAGNLQMLLEMDPQQREQALASLADEDRQVVEEALARQAGS